MVSPPDAKAAATKAQDPFAESAAAVSAVAAGTAPADASDLASSAGASGDDITWETGSMVKRQRSIYDSWTEGKRYLLLILMSFATFLVPFSDTVFLPSLNVIQKDLNTTATLMASTISTYMFVCGVTALFWGPFADRYGRRITLLIASAAFTGMSIGCVFATTIGMLIAFRALQGGCVSAMMVSANAVLADSWEPAQRGKAMGIYMIPTLVGPIVGPLLGGGLAQGLGWRSTFVAMAICGGGIFLAMLFFMEETHHHHVLKRIRTTEGDLAALSIKEAPQIQTPKFRAPWRPLRYLLEVPILPHALVTFLLYSTMFAALIILPNVLAHHPYNLSEALIGVANLPLGLGCFIVGPFGGRWADAGARRWNASPAGRMVPGTIAALLLFPPAALAYAWTLQAGVNLAGPLISSFFMGAAICAFFPGVLSYVSILKQHAAAAAGGAVQAMMFICGGVFTQITPPAIAALGIGGWVSLLVGVCVATTLLSAALTSQALKAGALAKEQLPVVSGAPGADAKAVDAAAPEAAAAARAGGADA